VVDVAWRPSRFHRFAVVFGIACYLVTAVLLLRLDDLEREVLLAGKIGILLVIVLPVVLAVMSLWSRPALLLPAAILNILESPMMWSGLPLVFLPGLLYGIAYVKDRPVTLTALQIAAAIVIPVALGVSALVVMLSDTTWSCAEERGPSGGRGVCGTVPSNWSVIGATMIVIVAAGAAGYVSTPLAGQPNRSISSDWTPRPMRP
jgi:hypothetical protein